MTPEEFRKINIILKQANTSTLEEQNNLISLVRETSNILPSSSPNKTPLNSLAEEYTRMYVKTKK